MMTPAILQAGRSLNRAKVLATLDLASAGFAPGAVVVRRDMPGLAPPTDELPTVEMRAELVVAEQHSALTAAGTGQFMRYPSLSPAFDTQRNALGPDGSMSSGRASMRPTVSWRAPSRRPRSTASPNIPDVAACTSSGRAKALSACRASPGIQGI
ncbi:hypothetical protein FHS96_005554 [Sphingomonas zeicaulis]|uniref:hypothetical protein n=1 Tax=Sphingomonas zeicaulis TaxID=1632740 RepID=UPI003D236BF4